MTSLYLSARLHYLGITAHGDSHSHISYPPVHFRPRKVAFLVSIWQLDFSITKQLDFFVLQFFLQGRLILYFFRKDRFARFCRSIPRTPSTMKSLRPPSFINLTPCAFIIQKYALVACTSMLFCEGLISKRVSRAARGRCWLSRPSCPTQ